MLVLILYSAGRKEFSLDDPKKNFEDLYSYFMGKGIKLCRAPIEAFEETKKSFSKAQFFEEGKWVWKENVIPEIVFDKSPFFVDTNAIEQRKKISDEFIFVNDLEISNLMSDKWENYQEFTEYYPKTVLVRNQEDLKNIGKLESDKVILKPLTGSGGKGIVIMDKKEVNNPIQFPFIAQELISTSRPHDLRVIVANDNPFYSFMRIPQRGKLLANISQGGKIEVMPIAEVPASVLDAVGKIGSKLNKFKNKLYSVDFIVDDKGRPWVLEMNSRPGIILEKEEMEYKEYFYDNLIKFFLNIKK